jgi:translation initiation factor 2 subunit 2
MADEEYVKMLDRAFSKMPTKTDEKSDFKIPTPDILVEGNKTIIRNASTIADKARRKPEEISRYLSKELGVPASAEDQRIMVSGKFDSDEMKKRINRFFELYVICRECHKPDSHMESAGRGMFYFVCEACGARYGVKSY